MLTRFLSPLSDWMSILKIVKHKNSGKLCFLQGNIVGYISPNAQILIDELGLEKAIPCLAYAHLRKSPEDTWIPVILLKKYYIFEENGLFGAKYANGNCLVTPKYQHLYIDDEVVLTKLNGAYQVKNWNKEIIYPYHKYEFMDDFEHGFSRVKSNSGWGIVDKYGNEVVQCAYAKIWKFAGNPTLEKLHVVIDCVDTGYFTFDQLSATSTKMRENPSTPYCFPNKYSKKTICKLNLENDKDYNRTTEDYGIDWRKEAFYAMTDGQYGDFEDGDIDPDCLGF